MILEHIAQHTGTLIIAATPHDDRLSNADLYVVDVLPVPEWLEDRVGKAKREDVLHRFLSQIVVNAQDLILAEGLVNPLVEPPCAGEVVPEGLLDDNAYPPFCLPLALPTVQACSAESIDNCPVQRGRNGQIEEGIARPSLLSVQGLQRLAHPLVGIRVVVSARKIRIRLG